MLWLYDFSLEDIGLTGFIAVKEATESSVSFLANIILRTKRAGDH